MQAIAKQANKNRIASSPKTMLLSKARRCYRRRHLRRYLIWQQAPSRDRCSRKPLRA